MPSKNERIVGCPLTPAILAELGALNEIPASSDDFGPDGDWVNTYRVWTCHGYRESGNDDEGFLRIARTSGLSDRPFTLKVDQEVLHDRANLHSIHAEIQCSPDLFASPSHWRLSSRLIGPDGAARPELGLREESRVEDGKLKININGRTFERNASEAMTADWCLFEAIQRLPFENFDADAAFNLSADLHARTTSQGRIGINNAEIGPFDVLEGLNVVRTEHRIAYRGIDAAEIEGCGGRLHRFEQCGQGTLPYEYWLDENHRLIIVATGARAYILDEKAVEKADAAVLASRRYQQQRQEKRSGGNAS